VGKSLKKIGEIKKQVLLEIKPSEERLKEINKEVREFSDLLKENLKKKGLKADVFVGGSFAKGTFLRKENYDVDIFVRFDRIYDDSKLSEMTASILKNIKFKVKRLHGSRDYFQAIVDDNLVIEIVPVRKISKPEQSV